MPFTFYDAGPSGFWVFLVVSPVLGGLAAFVSGRALADTWRPRWQLPLYMLLLAAAVRFIQFAVFGATLLSWPSYLVDLAILLAICLLGYSMTRQAQMSRQYGWNTPTD